MDNKLNRGDIVWYACIMPTIGIYDVCELIIRTVEDDYFVGLDKSTKRALLFSMNDLCNVVFQDRKNALNKVKEAEKNKTKTITHEKYYEEY